MKRFISKRLYKFYLNEGDMWAWCLYRMSEGQSMYNYHKFHTKPWYVNPLQLGD